MSPDNLSPADSLGHTTGITDANPAVSFPIPNYSDVDYVVTAGSLQPVLLVARDWLGAFTPSAGGIIPPTLPPRAYYDHTTNVESIVGMKLFDDAITRDHLSYQDACFVIASKDGVELVYVSANPTTANILGHKVIHTPTYSTSDYNLVASDPEWLISQSILEKKNVSPRPPPPRGAPSLPAAAGSAFTLPAVKDL